MLRNFYIFFIFIFAIGIFSLPVKAQIVDATTSNGRPRQEEALPTGIQESLKKMEIERLKKDYDEMLENGELAVKLTEEVEDSFNKSNKLNSEDIGKLEKIEKLLKKIRKELGGDDVEVETEPEKPATIKNAITVLKTSAENLFDELKKTSRYSISVVAIQSSNSLINIVRFIRFWKK